MEKKNLYFDGQNKFIDILKEKLTFKKAYKSYLLYHMYIHKNIKFLRNLFGMTQKDVGGLIGIGQSHVVKIEKGNRSVNILQAIALSDHFGVTLDDLIKKDLSKLDTEDLIKRKEDSINEKNEIDEITAMYEKRLGQLANALLSKNDFSSGKTVDQAFEELIRLRPDLKSELERIMKDIPDEK